MKIRLPSYRLHKPSGQAVCTLSGRDIYLGRYGSIESKAEYNRVTSEWLTGGRRLASGSDLSVAELVRDFMAHARTYYQKHGKPTSEVEFLTQSFRLLLEQYGHTDAKSFGPIALKTVRDAIIATDVCRNVVNGRCRRIVRLFKWAVENEKVPASVHHGLVTVSGLKRGRSEARETEPVRPVHEALVDAIRPYLSRQIWTIIDLMRLTGMRPGEACQMRTCDLDTSGKVWVYTPGSHKTEHRGRSRQVFIGPAAQAVLKPWLRTTLDEYLFQPREAEAERIAERRRNRTTPQSPSHRARKRKTRPEKSPGDVFTPRVVAHAVGRACQRADVPNWHPNQLRHLAATRLRREHGIDMARIIMGHSDVTTTQIYAEADREKAVAIIAKIG